MRNQRNTLQIKNVSLPLSREDALAIADAITSRLKRELTAHEFVALMDNADKNDPEFTMQFDGMDFQFIVKHPRVFKTVFSVFPTTTEGEAND